MAETFHICAPLATQILKTFNAEAQKRKDMALPTPQPKERGQPCPRVPTRLRATRGQGCPRSSKIFAARDKVGI
jgi:hypothetical protein